MQIFTMSWGATQAAELAGTTSASLQNWLKRDLIVGHRVKGGGVQGRHRSFSFSNVMELAMIQRLCEAGLGAASAARAAPMFAHADGGGKVFDLPYRHIALPFHFTHGRTIFGVSPRMTFEELWKPGEAYDTFGRLRGHLGSNFICVDASEVFDVVCGRLQSATGDRSFHPNAILDEAYPEEAARL